jgi:phage anti-repressor protein
MNELIKITENEGKKAVNARDLYEFLGFAPQHWAKWYKKNIVGNTFAIENEDFVKLPLSGRSFDCALSIDFAKKLSMLARTEQGEKARQYFIECEKVALENKTQLSEIEILQRSLTLLIEQQKKVAAIETRVLAIENKPQINAPVEHFSILGYCHNIGKQISLNEAKSYGLKCRRMCNELGMLIGKVSDPRFGSVNTYPLDVLKDIIK